VAVDGVPDADVQAAATLLAAAADLLAARAQADTVRRRLAENERIGSMGSFDWHVPTDTNVWSDELYRIYGHTPGSIDPTYETFLGLLHPEDRDRIRAIHTEAATTGQPFEMEERIVRPDGQERMLWSFGEVELDEQGAPLRMFGVCRDVTEQRAAEAQALAAQRHVAEAEERRRQALELNDTVVQGLVTLLWRLDEEATAEARRAAEATLNAAKRVVTDLLRSSSDEVDRAALVRRSHALPVPENERELPAEREPAAVPHQALRLVLADDAADVRLLLRLHLDRLEEVELVGEAADGEEAVRLVEQVRPDVVLLDVSMPVLDGLEAAQRIRLSSPVTRIIVFSGYPAELMADRARAAGADEYVEKTGDLTALLGALRASPRPAA
jgi:PAS domain S-box-containing protein